MNTSTELNWKQCSSRRCRSAKWLCGECDEEVWCAAGERRGREAQRRHQLRGRTRQVLLFAAFPQSALLSPHLMRSDALLYTIHTLGQVCACGRPALPERALDRTAREARIPQFMPRCCRHRRAHLFLLFLLQTGRKRDCSDHSSGLLRIPLSARRQSIDWYKANVSTRVSV